MAAVVGGHTREQDVARNVVAGRIDGLDAATAAATAELVNRAREAFTAGLVILLLVAGVVVLASAIAALLLVRDKDVLVPAPTPSRMNAKT